MDNSQQTDPGFTPHVMNQLQEMAAVPGSNNRGRSRGKRGRAQYQRFEFDHRQGPVVQPNLISNRATMQLPSGHTTHISQQTADAAHLPPLTSNTPLQPISHLQASQQVQQPYPEQRIHGQHLQDWQTRRTNDVSTRGRYNGGYGGRARGGRAPHTRPEAQTYSGSDDQFHRPQPGQSRLYNPGGNPYFGTADQQRAFRHKIMSQSDFLGTIATQALQNQISQEEFREKEAFRKVIQDIAQEVILAQRTTMPKVNVANVKLKLYGSLGSGFGVAGSDMDLLLSFPQNESYQSDIEIESRRWLEKGLLDAGYGARLLTNTRVPILKVCERPSDELLRNLRDYRQQWDESVSNNTEEATPNIHTVPLPPSLPRDEKVIAALEQVSLEAIEIPLPDSNSADQVKLEFAGDCGIQCDINFTNYVALRNTELLRTYGQCDTRVRQVGLFIKHWAKARDINTPYKGTLSSYGYIMMVLHYLMNIVSPPIIPNLQLIARDQDAWERKTEIETVEGFDVRFVRDPDQLRHIMANMKPNHESLGSLLRGFFWYYACNGGFHWTRDTISIRSPGGQVSKHSKGWTGAKWSESKQNVRLRYLLAIEDPFETEHNVGRTVGHSGIVAIRDEFRRAWSIIENVQLDEVQRVWMWSDKGSSELRNAVELVEKLENRGDLLRKDQIAHRDRMRQMRKEAEADEQALRNALSEVGKTDQRATDADSTIEQ